MTSSWNLVELGEVCMQRSEIVEPRKISNTRFIGLEHIGSGKNVIEMAGNSRDVKSSKFRFFSNDLLYGKLRPYLDKCVVAPFDGICSTDLIVLEPVKERTASNFLVQLLHSTGFLKHSVSSTTGTNHPRTTWKQLAKFRFGLPPLREQSKIAEILSTLDDTIQKAEQVIAHTERLRKGLLSELIGKIAQFTTLAELGTLQYGLTASAVKTDSGIRFLRITDIDESGEIDWRTVPFCEATSNEIGKYLLGRGDLLFARIGSTTGKSCFIHRDVKSVFGSYLIRFRVDNKSIDPEFLYYFTQSSEYWEQINRNKEGQLKKGVNTAVLKGLKVPFPSIQVQRKVAEIVSAVDSKTRLEREKKVSLERIRKRLLDDLVSGKVRHPEFM